MELFMVKVHLLGQVPRKLRSPQQLGEADLFIFYVV